ncbi:hypothetical protein [Armatimonas sp.]|uniref:hypothetical protein n=1 Tax=Armatimonas sp. TaxID=1872638 RepID=UPI00286C2F25|nr:hypothetical protein [Armatimonas sp.]
MLSEAPADDLYGDGSFQTELLYRFTCHAQVGEIEWVGSHFGLQRIDNAHQTVTLVTPREGLPAPYVEAIIADTQATYALVRTLEAPFVLFLGQLTPEGEGWQTLAHWPLPEQEYPLERHASLSLSEDFVVVALPEVRQEDVAFCHFVERATHTLRSLPGHPWLRADLPKIAVYFAQIRADTLWLGTSAGLLSTPLGSPQDWERFLLERVCIAGEWASDGMLWCLTTPRQYTQEHPPFQLVALAPDGTPTVPVPIPHTARPPGRYPRGLALHSDGTLWVENLIPDTGHNMGWLCYQPQSHTWTTVPYQETAPAPPAAHRLLAFTAFPTPGSTPQEDPRFPWRQQHFPSWHLRLLNWPLPSRISYGLHPDPEDPTLSWWVTENTLVCAERSQPARHYRPPDGIRLDSELIVDRHSVWGRALSAEGRYQGICRLDRGTGQFWLYDASFGKWHRPALTDGQALWLLHCPGTWWILPGAAEQEQVTEQEISILVPDLTDSDDVYWVEDSRGFDQPARLVRFHKPTKEQHDISLPPLWHVSALLVEKEHLWLAASRRGDYHHSRSVLFRQKRSHGGWEEVSLPAHLPPLTFYRMARTPEGRLRLGTFHDRSLVCLDL